MKKIILGCILYLTLVGQILTSNSVTSKIVKVVDGDTIKVKINNKVINCRLAGIDTPESYLNRKAKKDIKKCKIKDYKYLHIGLTAKEYLEDKYKNNKFIKFKIIDKGRYNRPIVMLLDNTNYELVRKGLAIVKDYNNLNKKEITDLMEFEKKAIKENIGIWRYLNRKCF